MAETETVHTLLHRLWTAARGDGERPKDYDKQGWQNLESHIFRMQRELDAIEELREENETLQRHANDYRHLYERCGRQQEDLIKSTGRRIDELREENERLKSELRPCDHHFESDPGMYDTSHRYCTKCGRAE